MASKPFDVDLYGGLVNLRRGKNHTYYVRVEGGKAYRVPNATTIIGMKDKSRALIPWALRTAAEAFLKSVPTNVTIKMTDRQRQRIADAIISAPDTVRDEAGDIGTQVHDFIEQFLLTQIGQQDSYPDVNRFDKNLGRACGQFMNWYERNNVKPIAMEKPIFSRQHFYSGTMDIVLSVNGKLGVWDAKTGKSPYPEVMLQTSAYMEAYNEEHPNAPVTERGLLFFPREDQELIGDMDAFLLPDTHERDFATFLALKDVYEFDKKAFKELRDARHSGHS